MASTITNAFKKFLVTEVLNDIADSATNTYYAGIGKCDDWDSSDTPTTPVNSERDIRNALLSLQSVKQITDYTFTIPRNNWTSGAIYYPFDDNAVAHSNEYYVLTDENQVYVCLQQPKNATTGASNVSTVKPTGTLEKAFTTADNYTWKFLYSIGALNASKFLAGNFMPVKYIDSADIDSASPAADVEQQTIHNAATAQKGQILNIVITNAGSGYTSDPTITITGDGSGAGASVGGRSGGQLTSIVMDDDSASLGTNYSRAKVAITGGGGSGAAARAVIGPKLGLGWDPRDDLRSGAIMFNTKPDGAEGGSFILDNDFRQVMLLRNPLIGDSDGLFTAASGMALRKLKFTGGSGFVDDAVVIGGTSTARGIINEVDSDYIYYHQNETTGFGTFTAAEALTTDPAGGTGTVVTDSAGDVEQISGELLYLDNRAAIVRATDQTEDIKIVIQL